MLNFFRDSNVCCWKLRHTWQWMVIIMERSTDVIIVYILLNQIILLFFYRRWAMSLTTVLYSWIINGGSWIITTYYCDYWTAKRSTTITGAFQSNRMLIFEIMGTYSWLTLLYCMQKARSRGDLAGSVVLMKAQSSLPADNCYWRSWNLYPL